MTAFETIAAAPIELRCDGTTYIYENGFGVTTPLEANDARIIKVDLINNLLESSTFYGNRVGKAGIDEESFQATLFHGFYYKGTYIYGEKVFINRYTGYIISMYVSSKDDTRGYGAFSGTCKKGTKKF
jgi:hypothetical protein